MNELDIQKELCDAGNKLGGHCFKSNNRFMKGVLDLSVQLPDFAHVFIEVKFARSFVRKREVKLDLTPHQRRFIVRTEQAGGCAGWLMVVARGRGAYTMDCSLRVPSGLVLFYDNHWLEKRRGGEWPIKEIVKALQR